MQNTLQHDVSKRKSPWSRQPERPSLRVTRINSDDDVSRASATLTRGGLPRSNRLIAGNKCENKRETETLPVSSNIIQALHGRGNCWISERIITSRGGEMDARPDRTRDRRSPADITECTLIRESPLNACLRLYERRN